MTFTRLQIPGLWTISPSRHGDSRGWFSETFRQDLFRRHIGDITFVQDNESFSTQGVVRGLHFQRGVHSQAKLVRVTLGRVIDYAVDLRPGSPTFGRHAAVELSDADGTQLFIPRGFAHGFAVISPEARFQYKCDNYYNPGAEATLLFSDPALDISLPFPAEQASFSQKDLNGLPLNQLITDFPPYVPNR